MRPPKPPTFPYLRFPRFPWATSLGTVILCYGATPKKNYSDDLTFIVDQFRRIGFDVCTFDYRSNTHHARFSDFGIHDRIKDTRIMFAHALRISSKPISVIAFGMGCHTTIQAITTMDGLVKPKNIFLVAPAAYPSATENKAMKFGALFRKLANQPNEWLTSGALKSVSQKITADILVLRFEHDKSDRKKMADAYHAAANRNTTRRRQLVKLSYSREGALTRPTTVVAIINEIRRFLAEQ